MTTRTALRTRVAAAAAALVGITLTACGSGSGMDGTYYAYHDEDAHGQLIIDDSSLIYYPLECEDGKAWVDTEDVDAKGELNEEGTAVRWASDDEHIATDAVGGTESVSVEEFESGKVITIGDHEFTPGDEEEILKAVSESCS